MVQRATAAAFAVGMLIGALMAARGGAVTAPRPRTERLQLMAPPVMVEDAEAAEEPESGRRRRRRQRDARDRGKRRGASARRGHAIGAKVGAAASASDATAAAAAVSASANAAAAAAAAAAALSHRPTSAPVPAARSGTQDGARTLGPYYGDLEGPGELERAVRLVSSEGELVLLHGNEFRLRMLVNLVAELNSHGLYNALLLGFTSALCDGLRVRGAIGCAHSSYMYTGALAVRAQAWGLRPNYRAWLQKFHYMRRFLEMRVNVLALDSDVILLANPYPPLRGAFGDVSFVTAFDTKGGFANVNVGIVSLQNASVGGPVHELFIEFERRVWAGLLLTPPEREGQRQNKATQLFWDQNLFNKVLLSALAGRPLHLPDGSTDAWDKAHSKELWQLGRPTSWNTSSPQERAPSPLAVRRPWYPRRAEYRWWQLTAAAAIAGATAGVVPGAADGTAADGSAQSERLMLAPPWLISADNSLGHRYKHWLYSSAPAPCALLHFVCVATHEASRILPMRLFGHWHEAAVAAEVNALQASRLQSDPTAQPLDLGPSGAAAPGRRLLLALEPGTFDTPLRPAAWDELNVLHTALGGLAALAGRVAVLPVFNCSGVEDGFLQPGALPSRCFWHVHRSPSRATTWDDRTVRCVFRLGNCAEDAVAPPSELEEALAASALAGNAPPPLLEVPLQSLVAARAAAAVVADLTGPRYRDAKVVRVRLRLPGKSTELASQLATPSACHGVRGMLEAAGHAQWAARTDDFCVRCRELTDRSKKRKKECTNQC